MAGSERTEAGAAQTTPAAPSATTSAASAEEGTAGIRAGREAPGLAPSGTTTSLDGFRVDCLMNARYHSAREAFLDSVHRWLMLGVIILGSAAMLDLFEFDVHGEASSFIKTLLAALPVVFGALDLTFDLSNRARIHALMKRRYFELLAEVTGGEKTIEQADAAMHRFSADEEPAYHALLATAWNAAQEMVYGDRAKHYELWWPVRWSKQFFRFEGGRFPVREGASS
jgi:hypothetical protein